MSQLTRRDFARSLAAAGVGTALSAARVLGANDRVRVGFIGLGNRGDQVLDGFLKQTDCEMVAICDLYQPYLDFAARKIGTSPKQFKDYRKVQSYFSYGFREIEPGYTDYCRGRNPSRPLPGGFGNGPTGLCNAGLTPAFRQRRKTKPNGPRRESPNFVATFEKAQEASGLRRLMEQRGFFPRLRLAAR